MSNGDFLTNQFLIAMPAMTDDNFSQTVTLICEHNPQGALGIIINRPLDMQMADIFRQLKLPASREPIASRPVLQGGPVQTDRGFVVHRAEERSWDSTLRVSDQVHVTTSRDILDALAHGDGPADAFVALGYAGWDAGQLENEMVQNAWLSVAAAPKVLFETPYEDRWRAAGRLLGIDLATLSSHAGHA